MLDYDTKLVHVNKALNTCTDKFYPTLTDTMKNCESKNADLEKRFKCKKDALFQNDSKNNNKHKKDLSECIWNNAPYNVFLKDQYSNKLEYY
ncbi:hypothetical protein WR25_10833 [Diploscapter pachys]|uniref:Uncharacterized protein n=1 Tax=Diploscapter pachys TaxID=2018661 RepID=A0A2A2JAG1_9BILA|nr:hypothetical protein WR25_10833 [Diploscapter pachys]